MILIFHTLGPCYFLLCIYIYSFDAFFWGIATRPVFNLGTLSRSAQRHWIEVQEEWDKMAQPLPFALMWNDGCLEKVCVQLKVQSVSRWWFQICVIFIPTFGKLSNFTKIFQMGLKPPTSFGFEKTNDIDDGTFRSLGCLFLGDALGFIPTLVSESTLLNS